LGFQTATSSYLEKFGNTMLSPFSSNGKIKLIMVMVIFPVILTAFNFWIIDNILKFNPENNEEGELVTSVYEMEEVNNRSKYKTDVVRNVMIGLQTNDN
jgi:hypothetical protein